MDLLPSTLAIYNAGRFAVLSCSYQIQNKFQTPTYCLNSLGITAEGKRRHLQYEVRKKRELGALPIYPCCLYIGFKPIGTAHYTYSNEELYYSDSKAWIPIVIFSIDLPFQFHFSATNDTDYLATRRAYFFKEIQRKLSHYKVPELPEPEEDPRPPTPPIPLTLRKVPPFVAEALLQAAILKKEECSLSLQSFELLPSVSVTPCFHLFSNPPLLNWLKKERTCPLCKDPITLESLYSLDLRK